MKKGFFRYFDIYMHFVHILSLTTFSFSLKLEVSIVRSKEISLFLRDNCTSLDVSTQWNSFSGPFEQCENVLYEQWFTVSPHLQILSRVEDIRWRTSKGFFLEYFRHPKLCNVENLFVIKEKEHFIRIRIKHLFYYSMQSLHWLETFLLCHYH